MRAFNGEPHRKAAMCDHLCFLAGNNAYAVHAYNWEFPGRQIRLAPSTAIDRAFRAAEPDARHNWVPAWLPTDLRHLVDTIFGGLAYHHRRGWALRFIKAIPVGAELDGVWPAFLEWVSAPGEQQRQHNYPAQSTKLLKLLQEAPTA